jgi:hypothetical protein
MSTHGLLCPSRAVCLHTDCYARVERMSTHRLLCTSRAVSTHGMLWPSRAVCLHTDCCAQVEHCSHAFWPSCLGLWLYCSHAFWPSCLGLWLYCSQILLNYLAFQYFDYLACDFERTWWRLLQKRVVCTKLDIYIFIKKKKIVGRQNNFIVSLGYTQDKHLTFSVLVQNVNKNLGVDTKNWGLYGKQKQRCFF